jgi:tetratricopeptide (TPR) repeat protein
MPSADPFRTHCAAFDAAVAGHWREAAAAFSQALREYDAMLADPASAGMLERRVGRNPDARTRAAAVTREFLEHLPGWLCELHFDRFRDALWRAQSVSAGMHWRAVALAAGLPRLGGTVNLRDLRDMVCQRFDLTSERMTSSGDKAAEGLRLAERILSADTENDAARYRAIEGYTHLIGTTIAKIRPDTDKKLPGLRLTPGQKRRMERSLRSPARRLRIHLSRASRAEGSYRDVIVAGYRQLSAYYAYIGDLAAAIRMARRVRRLNPTDPDLDRWYRALKRAWRSQ